MADAISPWHTIIMSGTVRHWPDSPNKAPIAQGWRGRQHCWASHVTATSRWLQTNEHTNKITSPSRIAPTLCCVGI